MSQVTAQETVLEREDTTPLDSQEAPEIRVKSLAEQERARWRQVNLKRLYTGARVKSAHFPEDVIREIDQILKDGYVLVKGWSRPFHPGLLERVL